MSTLQNTERHNYYIQNKCRLKERRRINELYESENYQYHDEQAKQNEYEQRRNK